MDMKKCNEQQIHCFKNFLNWNKSLIDYENIALTIALSEKFQPLGLFKDEYL
jgi:glutathionyl-hydroquinone reductase